MPERYATPASLLRLLLSGAHTTLHAIGAARLTLAPNQRGLDGLDNVTVGSDVRIWFGSAHTCAHLAWREAQSLGGYRLPGSLPIPERGLFSSEADG